MPSRPSAEPRPRPQHREKDQLSAREARALAIASQGLAGPRVPRRSRGAGPGHLTQVINQVGTIQVDAVNVLARTQFLVPFSRAGSYDPRSLRAMTGPGAPWFEYWGHAASLLPVELQPLFRPRMAKFQNDLVDSPTARAHRRAWRANHAAYLAAVLAEVSERGPLAASQLSEPRRQSGEWWDRRSLGRRALEMLFCDGVLAAWRSATFERIYDLAERVIPAHILALPTPSEDEALRELLALAGRCLGVATVADLADYFWVRPARARPAVAELVEDGRLSEVAVEGWREPGYVVPGTTAKPVQRADATLLSPFDSLIWTRARTERLFGFHFRIEIYVPSPQRKHGYYVLPMLLGDALVARFDLKADRRSSALLVVAAHAEPGLDDPVVAGKALAELERLRTWLDLEHLVVGPRGDLAPLLVEARERS
ncbi:MAG TPA: crosslink repair DNA glycosylase YcaQ family protein [Acidimicrobiales bacterium]|nr:crosslink repair DNA glycosylase YcaQ family protein [Acidimicrobiales bacterium]